MGESRDSLEGNGIDSRSRKGSAEIEVSYEGSSFVGVSAGIPDVAAGTAPSADTAPGPTPPPDDYITEIAAEVVRKVRNGEDPREIAEWSLREAMRREAPLLDAALLFAEARAVRS